MKSREVISKFDCSVENLMNYYLSNKEIMKQLPFKKFNLVSLSQEDQKKDILDQNILKRRFLLNLKETKIPQIIKSFIQDKKIEWEETVVYQPYTNSGTFKIELVSYPNLNSKFACWGDVRFLNLEDTNKSKRLINVHVDIASSFVLKNTFESFVLDEIWLMLQHEAEIVNADIISSQE